MELKHKYQIFISSTFSDLQDERRAAIDTVLCAGHIPLGMEVFRGDDQKQKVIIEHWLQQIDIYILILGVRYGDIDPETKISYTEWEYNMAEKMGIPRLVILLDDTYIRSKNYDYTIPEINIPQYIAFKERLKKEHYVHFVSNIDQLKFKIQSNIEYIISENKGMLRGWIDGKYEDIINQIEMPDSAHKNVIIDWGLNHIFRSRAEKNIDSDSKLKLSSIKQLDAIAFGLKTFRSSHTDDVKIRLQDGMKIRLLVMDPDGEYIHQREREELEVDGQISNSIRQLVNWAKKLHEDTGGDIQVKFYNSMTLDFYWRIGDTVYVGPYLYGKASQATITYKYIAGGMGFETYTQYFESLWNDESLTKAAF